MNVKMGPILNFSLPPSYGMAGGVANLLHNDFSGVGQNNYQMTEKNVSYQYVSVHKSYFMVYFVRNVS